MGNEEHLTEISEAAKRAGYIVTEQIDSIIERAERDADAIRRDAERDAEDTRREAVEAAERLLGRLQALEFPLGSLVADLRDEMQQVAKQLGEGGRSVDSQATPLPAGPERPHEAASAPMDEPEEREVQPEEREVQPAEREVQPEDREHEPDDRAAGDEAPGSPSFEAAPQPSGEPTETAQREGWRRWVTEDDELIGTAEHTPEPSDEKQ